MRIAYAGTPPFAATILAALLASAHRIVLVLTQPDRPAGRGMKLSPSAVKQLAQAHGVPVAQPVSLKTADAQQGVHACAPDVMVVAAYGLILPQAVLDIPKHGAINVHASLLPRWRGAAPIQRALLAGDTTTGVTIMRMDAGLDTGYMLMSKTTPLLQSDTSGSVEKRLAQLGAEALLQTLAMLGRCELQATPQPEAGVSYASKVQKEEARLDFSRPAEQLDRVVRAFNPSPIAFTTFRGENLRIWRAEPLAQAVAGAPGSAVLRPDGSVAVACGTGALLLHEVQRPGGKPMPAALWAAGAQPQAGERFGA